MPRPFNSSDRQRHIDRATSRSLVRGGSVGKPQADASPAPAPNPALLSCAKCRMNGVLVKLTPVGNLHLCDPCQADDDPDSICDGCSQSYPMSELENVDGQELCPICAEQEAENNLGDD